MRKAFTFTEVLFAVMILGVGFIMVAAIFPVAIHQTEASNRETIGASIGRAGASYISQVAANRVYFQLPSQPIGLTSALVPTFQTPPTPVELPLGTTTLTLPGAVWNFFDTRDAYSVSLPTSTPPQLATAVLVPQERTYLWQLIAQNMIQATDPRFAWVAMYKRDYIEQGAPQTTPTPVPAPYAQVILIAVQAQVAPAYDPVNNISVSSHPASPLLPVMIAGVSATVPTTASPFAVISFRSAPAAENAYVVVSDDGITNTNPALGVTKGAYNGRIYRLGAAANGSTNEFFFAPGQGPATTDTPLNNATVLVVGKAADPAGSGTYVGAAQDVAAYTTFVQTP